MSQFPASQASQLQQEGVLDLPPLELPRVDFIKMDIEGAERNALRGARGVLKESGPKMTVAAYHRQDDPEVIQEVVLGARPGYEIVTTEGDWGGILYASVPK